MSDVARDLSCCWYVVMDAVVAIGEQLIDHPNRIGTVTTLGLDETLFAWVGPFRTQRWFTPTGASAVANCSTSSLGV